MVVVWSLRHKVAIEMVARDFRLHVGQKGEVMGFRLEKGFSIFCFKEIGEWDLVLSWVIASQALAVEPWRPGYFPTEGAVWLGPTATSSVGILGKGGASRRASTS